MKVITSEVKKLLEKLYNLRGEDSVILKQMNEERENAIETQERTKNEKEVLLQEIDRLTNEEALLAEQGNKLMDVLANINRDEFSFVLEELNIDFDPASINDKVNHLLPETIEKVVTENKTAKEKLENVENEMNNAITKVEELGIRKDEALSNQAKLNEYFDLALNGNINITRDEIVTLLQKFDFNEDEQREAAKLLMFPEDALFAYEEGLKNNNLETFASEDENAEFPQEEVVETQEENEVVIPSIPEEEKEEVVAEENVIPVENDEVEEETTSDSSAKGVLESLLNELGLQANRFEDKATMKLLENYDEDLYRKNINSVKEKNMDLDVLYENYELIYDKELTEKIDKLLAIGKDIEDISLMPSVLIKYDLNGLNNTINILQISGLDPKKVPLMAY